MPCLAAGARATPPGRPGRCPVLAAGAARPPVLGAADAAMLAVVAIWGASFSVVKHAYREIPALAFLGMRFALAVAATLPLLVRQRHRLRRCEALRGAALLGLLSVAGYQYFYSVGLQFTSASTSTLVVATGPLWTALFTLLVGGERPRRAQLAGMAVALGGVALLTLGAAPEPGIAAPLAVRGVALTLAAAAASGLAAVMAERYLRGEDGAVLMAAAVVAGGLVLVAGTWREVRAFPWSRVSPLAWGELLYAALAAGSLGYVLWYRSLSRIGAVRGSVYGFLIPVVGVLTAVLALGERPSRVQAAGALLVLLGIAMARGWLGPGQRRVEGGGERAVSL